MKGYKHLTQAERSEILTVYAETKSTRLTADRLGIQLQRARMVVKQAGLEPTNHRPGSCDHHSQTVIAMAGLGKSLSEISRAVGTNKARVKAWLIRHGIPLPKQDQRGDRNSHWKGGRTLDKHGYVLVLKPDHPFADSHGRVREHRIVMEGVLGRFLNPKEVVHHKDGDPANNDPANLEIFGTNTHHLRETLMGKTPEWTEEGVARMQAGIARSANQRRTSSRPSLEPDDVALPGKRRRRRS